MAAIPTTRCSHAAALACGSVPRWASDVRERPIASGCREGCSDRVGALARLGQGLHAALPAGLMVGTQALGRGEPPGCLWAMAGREQACDLIQRVESKRVDEFALVICAPSSNELGIDRR